VAAARELARQRVRRYHMPTGAPGGENEMPNDLHLAFWPPQVTMYGERIR